MKYLLCLVASAFLLVGCNDYSKVYDIALEVAEEVERRDNEADDTESDEVDVVEPEPEPITDNTLELKYHGRHNSDRATWYAYKPLDNFKPTVHVIVDGCIDQTLDISSGRYGSKSSHEPLIVKESSEPGRGLTVITSAKCKSKTARIAY